MFIVELRVYVESQKYGNILGHILSKNCILRINLLFKKAEQRAVCSMFVLINLLKLLDTLVHFDLSEWFAPNKLSLNKDK